DHRTQLPDTGCVADSQIALSRDGRRLAVATEDRVQVFDVGSRRRLALVRLPSNASSLSFSRDAERLVIGIFLAGLLGLDADGRIRRRFECEDLGTEILVSPDGQHAGCFDRLGRGQIVATESRKTLIRTDAMSASDAEFAADEKHLAVVLHDGTVRVWEL